MSPYDPAVQPRGRRWRSGAAGAAAALALLAGAVTTPAATPGAAGAGAPGLRAVHPNPEGYFEYTLGPGEQHVVDTAVVSNQGAAAADFLVYAADGYTSLVSGVVYGERDQPLRPAGAEGAGNGAGRWITPSTAGLHLDPGASVTISISTAVPPGTAPGDYIGGLVAENPTPATVNGGGLRVTQRAVVAIVVHVPGAPHGGWSVGAASISVENGRRQVITVPLASTGDLLAKPLLDGTIASCSGKVYERVDRRLDTFVPHSRIDYPITIDDQILPAGCYRLQARDRRDRPEPDHGRPGADDHRSAGAGAPLRPAERGGHPAIAPASGGVPLLVVVLVIGVVVLLLGNLLLLFLLRRRRRPEQPDEGGGSAA